VSGPRLDDSLTHHYSSFPLLLLVSFILKRNMNMKNFFNAAWLFFAVLATLASSEEYEESRNRLSESKPQSCELIIDRSRFYGTCCSLNATDSLGCVLNVANGWCRVSTVHLLLLFTVYSVQSTHESIVPVYNYLKIVGQYWTKTWNSTDDRIECDGSGYDVPYLTTGSGFTGDNGDISPAYTVTLLSVSALVAGATAFLF
jgi:hypothetical protein